MLHQLAELGVMAPLDPDTDVAAKAREATAAAQAWLERNPRPDPSR